jgi:hypothetical protein
MENFHGRMSPLAMPVIFLLLVGTAGWGSAVSTDKEKEKKPARDAAQEMEKERVAQVQVKTLTVAAQVYFINNASWPRSLTDLARPQPNGGKKFVDANALVDPWGKPYQYDPKGRRNEGDHPDVWTVTPGGKTIGNWPEKKE